MLKNIRLWLGLFLVACASLLSAAEATETTPIPKNHVFIVVIDGPRWCDTWGKDGRPDIPQRTALAAHGTLFTDFANDGVTKTTPGHTALLTGFYQDINNSGKELPAHPSLLQYYRAKTGAPAEDTWVICSKDKLEVLADTTDEQWKGTFNPSTDCGKEGKGLSSGYRDDDQTMDRLLAILGQYHPHAVLVNLRAPDSAGHANNWDEYLQGIRDTDAAIGRLWEFLQTDAVYAGTSILLVSNDHGRHGDGHKDGFVSHGDDCPDCRHIELLALGKGIPAGQIVEKHYGQVDVAVTAARLLGIDLPGSEGHPITEIMPSP
jgi:arylsulfatase A-like enzyme